MRTLLKTFFILSFVLLFQQSKSTLVTIKTVGATFSPDTAYVNLGDSIKFIIGISHDAREITDSAYNNNLITLYPGGFNFGTGTFYFIVDSVKTYYYACTFHMVSNQMKGVMISTNPAGIGELEKTLSPFIYPNPATNFIYFANINSSTNKLRILDMHGRVVFIAANNAFVFTNGLNISFLKQGMYLFEFISVDEKRISRFVKE